MPLRKQLDTEYGLEKKILAQADTEKNDNCKD